MSRPKLFDGPPLHVRLPADLHDAICRMALRRDEAVSEIIRVGMASFVAQNRAMSQTSAQ